MGTEILIPHNWRPRDYQEAAWRALEGGIKRFCLIWHRRAGKDDFALHAMARQAMLRPAVYWHMLPQAEQARKAIWEAVNPHTGMRRIDEAFPVEIREKTREDTMSIHFRNGSVWYVVGSNNFNSLVGTPPAGVVFSEWALADPQAWGYLRPILAENDGLAMFITTPRGPNHALKTYQNALNSPGWFAEALTADDTGVFTKQQLELEREEMINDYGREQGEALFRQEYYVSFDAAVIGAIYGKEISRARDSGRITDVLHDPQLPVGTCWDLGYTDSTAIWFFQLNGDAVRFIDFYSASNESLDHYVRVLKDKSDRLGYQYDRTMMIFPHDIEVTELSSGISRKLTLQKMGVPVRVARKTGLWDGVNAVRSNFHRFFFDANACEKGIEALTLYRREWDDKNKQFSSKPRHDWTSHAADALRYGAVMFPRSSAATSKLIANKRRDVYDIDDDDRTTPPSFWAA